jgi:mono/diheme cytochrome c family protein
MYRMAGVLFLTMAGAAGAQDLGDARMGLGLAEDVCSPCHAIRAGQSRSPNPEAPAFETLANIPGMTGTALTVALRTSHRTMPNLMFEGQELANLIAYILSLQRRQ